MERFYIIPEGNALHKETTDYIKNSHDINEVVKTFMLENNIKSKEYCAYSNRLYIVPTKEDETNFKNQLMSKRTDNGLKGFKINSPVNKNWVAILEDKKLSVLHRPLVQFYFNASGRGSNRLFFDNDILYCSYENEYDFKDPEGFVPINGSDFYKVIENIESRKSA